MYDDDRVYDEVYDSIGAYGVSMIGGYFLAYVIIYLIIGIAYLISYTLTFLGYLIYLCRKLYYKIKEKREKRRATC